MIEAVICLHCERLILLRESRSCRCQTPSHIICRECAKTQDAKNLGDIMIPGTY